MSKPRLGGTRRILPSACIFGALQHPDMLLCAGFRAPILVAGDYRDGIQRRKLLLLQFLSAGGRMWNLFGVAIHFAVPHGLYGSYRANPVPVVVGEAGFVTRITKLDFTKVVAARFRPDRRPKSRPAQVCYVVMRPDLSPPANTAAALWHDAAMLVLSESYRVQR